MPQPTLRVVDVGTGTPIVIVPGIQGRWEWMRPAVDALAREHRVITFSLADEPTSGTHARGVRQFDAYIDQVSQALDAAGLDRAVIGGVSFGGLVAARFAQLHPERVSGLVLVSALPLTWRPDPRLRRHLRHPWLHTPGFCLGSTRLYREIAVASGGGLKALRAGASYVTTVVIHPFSPTRMARRVLWWMDHHIDAPASAPAVPTLLVTGEPGLDRVVPNWLTNEHARLWPQLEHAVIPRTGHIGLVTRPDEFARTVGAFVDRCEVPEGRRRVG